jgi:leader peptidase (prepilin peptidase)/N-methyltransferase
LSIVLATAMELRLAILFVLGTIVGGQLNRGIYRLAWDKRSIGPWSAPHPETPPRRWHDRIPVFGWLGLARESSLHGAGYWLRPLLIELATGLGFAALYLWEMGEHHVPWLPGSATASAVPMQLMLHAAFVAHLVLISLMVIATFIDFDEKTIPDEITLPGTLAGLALAAAVPISLLPVAEPAPPGPCLVGFLKLTSPQMTEVSNWPAWLDGPKGLAIGLACFAAWCLAIMPRTWWTRSGPVKAVKYLVASAVRQKLSRWIAALFVVGGLGIFSVWYFTSPGSMHWKGLLSALVGMVFGGGLVWMVRIIGSHVLAKEAMGFGDVTLMAMIGTFVGWQPSLIIFFLAPVAGLVIALTQWVLTRRKDIAFGPFLCLATLLLIVGWGPIWNRYGWPVFHLGWWIVAILLVCLLLMGAMLAVWRAIAERVFD